MLYGFLVLFMSNLGAMVDWVLHPEISYLDEEHLVVGGITAITTILLLGAMEMDLARRKQMEATLHESNERLRSAETKISKKLRELESIVAMNPDIIFTVDRNVNLIMWNRTMEVVTGLATKALKNKPALELIIEEDRPSVLHSVQKCLEEGEGEVEARLFNAQGGFTLFQIKGVLLKDEEGSVVGITGSGRDITERKQAEEEIRDAHQRLAVHDRQMPLGHITYDKDFRVVGWNPAAERIFGWSADEVKEKHPFELFVLPEAQAHVSGVFAELIKSNDSSYSLDTNLRKDGKIIVCEWFITSLRDASGNVSGACAMAHDVTEKTQLERQLQTAQKMESVGTLAGGIAHDFNNVLTVIIGYGEMLKLRIGNDPKAISDLDQILRSAEHASVLTRQILTFARRQIIELGNLDLNQLVTDLEKLLRKVTREDIGIKTFLAEWVPTIRADQGQVEQVLMNLSINARDAMPGGGQLVVETQEAWLDEEYVRQYPYMKAGRYAVLSVSDTGIGMDEGTRERIFEPFFTTKGPDKGTGLGLAVVYGIVKQHDGFIHVYSEPGKGTTFRIYFPAVDVPPDSKVVAARGIIPEGSETILLAEDNESVRHLTEQTLISYGYKVLIACDGEEAVDIFRRHGKEIAMAVLDMVMPKMGGEAGVRRDDHHDSRAEGPVPERLFRQRDSRLVRPASRDSVPPETFWSEHFGKEGAGGPRRGVMLKKRRITTRDAVRIAIRDFLGRDETGLPVDTYNEMEVNAKADEVLSTCLGYSRRCLRLIILPQHAHDLGNPGAGDAIPGGRWGRLISALQLSSPCGPFVSKIPGR